MTLTVVVCAVPERIDFMEHIVQFAIGIDDEAITKKIQENAEKQITQNIQQKVEKSIFATDYYGKPTNHLTHHAETMFKNWLEEHKDEIINRASATLAANMAKSKAVKTAINNILEGVQNESN
jgi:uncharacterized membrane protein YheB (UPF0754 family)